MVGVAGASYPEQEIAAIADAGYSVSNGLQSDGSDEADVAPTLVSTITVPAMRYAAWVETMPT